MKKTIYLLMAVAVSWTSVLTLSAKDPLTTAGQLYDAGQWAAAQYELSKISPPCEGGVLRRSGVVEVEAETEAETLAALCAARLEDPAAGDLLRAALEKYPSSPRRNEMRFQAAVFEYRAGNYDEAARLFGETDPRRLSASDRDEYYFKKGHAEFTAGNFPVARRDLARVASDSPFRPHADYYTAYMDYSEGHYAAAKQIFAALASDPSYESLAPYYLLQIEFLEGNYPYVTEKAGQLIPATAMPRRAELAKMAAQSWFRQGNYTRALAEMKVYEESGGEMGREENYLKGYSSYRETRYADAAQHLAKATGADDSLSQNASYHLADAYLKLGDKKRAMQSFSIAAASGHDPAIAEDALFNYGKLLYETGGGRFNEAINVLGRYIDTWPASPRTHEAREYLIAAYYNSHDYDAAYNAILQHPDPDNNVLSALQKIAYFRALELWNGGGGDANSAFALLTTSMRHRYNPKYTALSSFWQGEILYAQGDYSAAIPRWEEYLRLSPTTERENIMARYNLGYANFNLQRWDQAASRFDDFLERHRAKDSYRADALNRKGDILHAQKSYWRAIESYDAAAAVGTSEKYYSAYERALMLGLVDRPDRKIESLQAIISGGEGPYVEDATYELGRTYITQDRYADGARTLAGFISKYPASQFYLPALSNLGLAWLNMGDRAQSMKYYKMIVESAPWSREAHDAMSGIRSLYVDAGDVDGYFAYARTAGVATDTGETQRDSLTFAAAERIYLSGDNTRAIPALENYLTSHSGGRYVPTSLGYLAGLYSGAGRHTEAADTWRRLSKASSDPSVKARAFDGIITSTLATKDGDRILALSEELDSMPGISADSRRRAQFAAAGILRESGRTDDATAIYETLAGDVRTAEGAESAFRLIEHLYDRGDYRAAEEAVFAFSEKGTPHAYWLGEAFLTLGDIYVREGDTFQARATYQSIVDGYSPSDDGIVAAAKERIAALK